MLSCTYKVAFSENVFILNGEQKRQQRYRIGNVAQFVLFCISLQFTTPTTPTTNSYCYLSESNKSFQFNYWLYLLSVKMMQSPNEMAESQKNWEKQLFCIDKAKVHSVFLLAGPPLVPVVSHNKCL